MVTLMQTPFLIPLLPFIAFMINLFWGKRLGGKSAALSIITSTAAGLASIPFISKVLQGEVLQERFVWLRLGSGEIFFGWLLDPVSVSLLFAVTLVGTLIQIYAAGYMHGDRRFPSFFAYMSLFMAAMLTLVIADNFLLFFIAWEMMGLCSYLLIGFWFEKSSAADAAKKAFLTTRIGDIGLFLGILTLFGVCGTLQFSELASALTAVQPPLLFIAAILIFCGTLGKSAQFPLYIWLPDAMEGPTPVSALIHAATMVAAGIYLLIRSFPLLEAGQALPVIAMTGALTAFFTACLALRASDIKRILAYSTISQLGFMTAAVGLGNPLGAMFHLLTHAFFKALLFMGAGSVIHACGTQDIRSLGGLLKKMQTTAWPFLAGCAALAGIPPFSGFWSKDSILLSASESSVLPVIYPALLITAFLTALYTFRLFFLTFTGSSRASGQSFHESPNAMILPLWILAVLALLAGFPGSPSMNHWLQHFLGAAPHAASEAAASKMMLVSGLISFAGVLLAAWMYSKPARSSTASDAAKPSGLLNRIMDTALLPFTRIDAAMNGLASKIARRTLTAGRISDLTDRYGVDNFVNFTGVAALLFSAALRQIQTGFIQNYLLIAFTGLVAFLVLGLR